MTPADEINMTSHPKTGFQARFLNPLYRGLSLDRTILAEEELLKRAAERNTSPNHDPPKIDHKQQNTERLEDLIDKTQPLLRIRTSIPLDPFPNEIVIDANKVSIIYRYFFASENIHSVFIKDISDVLVETSLIFSTLKIVDVGFTENSIDINYLKTKDALKARRIIQGLVVAQKNGIDLSKCEQSEIADKVEELGSVK